MEEKMDIFELSVPLETTIKNANAQNMNKYEHFITDITTRDVSVHPFEIGSRGYISPSNKANLKKLHKFCKPSVNFKAMCENLSSLVSGPRWIVITSCLVGSLWSQIDCGYYLSWMVVSGPRLIVATTCLVSGLWSHIF